MTLAVGGTLNPNQPTNLSCENANAHLIGWPISCAGHMYTRRYYRASHWLKNQRENIGRMRRFCASGSQFLLVKNLKPQREDFEKMRWLCEFRLLSHWLKIPRANFAK